MKGELDFQSSVVFIRFLKSLSCAITKPAAGLCFHHLAKRIMFIKTSSNQNRGNLIYAYKVMGEPPSVSAMLC